jgi:hypothetical protein
MSENTSGLLRTSYDEVSYEILCRQGYAFADKSGFIESLEDKYMTRYPVLLRPQGFGKSTFVQMLKCFYDISYKDRYEEIFNGKDTYKKNLPSHNTYHVINFDFSGVDTHSNTALQNSFFSAVANGIDNFKRRYPDFVFDYSEHDESDSVILFNSFTCAYLGYAKNCFTKGRTGGLYVMIDEYDKFANPTISQDVEQFRTIVGNIGFLRAFYASIKAGAANPNCIAKIFITGVSSVSLDSFTSGFNISLNVSSYQCFDEYAGFTEDELKEIIPQLVDIEELGVSTDEIIARMKPVYGGYCFSEKAEHTMFNSSMCLYYLKTVQNEKQFLPPEDYLDPASDHDSSKLQQLFAIAENGLADEIVEGYLSNDLFFLNKLAENINLNKTAKYNRDQFLSMLYYLGYLTIDKEASDSSALALKIPNLFMSKLFAQCIADIRLKTNTIFTDTVLDISSLRNVNDDISSFAASSTEFLSGIFTNQVLTHMSEMALNLTLYTKLKSLRGIFVEMQKSLRVDRKGENFADLVITVNKGKSNQCIYLIELKYITKSGASESKIQSTVKEATDQVQRYKSAREFRDRQVKAYAMIFVDSDCVYCG